MSVSTARTFVESAIVSVGTEQLSSKLGDDLVILNLKSGVYYGLDPVGARVWELAEKRSSAAAIRDAIANEFAVDPATAERDLADLLGQMESEGLIQVS
jgi:hypothetical protein